MRPPSRQIGSLALLALAVITALACLSAVGAVTALIVMATNHEPVALGAHDRNCAVVAWKAGEIHCFPGVFAGSDQPERGDLAVVAQAGSAR